MARKIKIETLEESYCSFIVLEIIILHDVFVIKI